MADLNFLVEVDRKDEGCTSTSLETWEPEEVAEHRNKIASYLTDRDKAAWVFDDPSAGGLISMILWRYRNRREETFETSSIFDQLDTRLFPPDGRFCEIFQLWVAPAYRRQGLASRLKRQAEAESLRQGVHLIYTHTEAQNTHVITMNHKLGYQEVRRGPIWDEIVRVSLIKPLGLSPSQEALSSDTLV